MYRINIEQNLFYLVFFRWMEEQSKHAKHDMTAYLEIINLAAVKMIRLMGQEGRDLVELNTVMVGLGEKVASLASLTCMDSTLQPEQEKGNTDVKLTASEMCTAVEDMLKVVHDIFQKTQPKTDFMTSVKKVGETSNSFFAKVLKEGVTFEESRVIVLAEEAERATRTLGQTVKETATVQEQARVQDTFLSLKHSVSRMVTTAKILSQTISHSSSGEHLTKALAETSKKLEIFTRESKEVSDATKAISIASGILNEALEDLVEYIKDIAEDPILQTSRKIVIVCKQIKEQDKPSEAIESVKKCGDEMKLMIQELKEKTNCCMDNEYKVSKAK